MLGTWDQSISGIVDYPILGNLQHLEQVIIQSWQYGILQKWEIVIIQVWEYGMIEYLEYRTI